MKEKRQKTRKIGIFTPDNGTKYRTGLGGNRNARSGYLPPQLRSFGPGNLNDIAFGEVKGLAEAYRRWGQPIILLTYLHLRVSYKEERTLGRRAKQLSYVTYVCLTYDQV